MQTLNSDTAIVGDSLALGGALPHAFFCKSEVKERMNITVFFLHIVGQFIHGMRHKSDPCKLKMSLLVCVSSSQGNLYEFLRLTGWRGSKVLYFGDHIYSDLAVSSRRNSSISSSSALTNTGVITLTPSTGAKIIRRWTKREKRQRGWTLIKQLLKWVPGAASAFSIQIATD